VIAVGILLAQFFVCQRMRNVRTYNMKEKKEEE
jgi:hypothetical protein